jgi:ABC-type sugar transport system substrate-binding protein
MSVTFINPGRSDEAYWVAAAQVMGQAARSLGVQLDVRYAERDHLKAVEIVRLIAAQPADARPEFVIATNDYATGPEILRLLEGSGVRVLMAFSGIHGTDRRLSGGPREKYSFFLGSLEPRAEDAGFLTAQALIGKARKASLTDADGRIHLLAIAGDRSTPSSVARNAGMRRAVAQSSDVVLDQVVFANWSRSTAAEKARWLFKRYPDARAIWSGSDQMAFGAMTAWREAGGRPGQDAVFSAINTSTEALDAVRDGTLSALAGGHFMAGAWALVMLYDYAHGHDFADEGLEQVVPMFTLFDALLASRFKERFGGTAGPLDFRRYIKVLNPRVKQYGFEFEHLLR